MVKNSLNKNKIIGIGLIGAGSRGLKNLADKITERGRELNMSVVAVCDNNPQRLAEAQKYLDDKLAKLGQKRQVKSYEAAESLVEDTNVDMVIITTPQN